MTPAPLALALLLAAGGAIGATGEAAAPSGEGALGALARGVSTRLGAPEEGRRGLALALTAAPAALGAPLSAALAASLGQAGWAVATVPAGPGAAGAARAAGADWLLTLTAGSSPDGPELAAVGEAVPLWSSFFLQARPGVRAAPPRPVSARAPADAAVRLLLSGAATPAPPHFTLRSLGQLPAEAVALAAGPVEGLGVVLLVVDRDRVRLLDRSGLELASRRLGEAGRARGRAFAATAVVAPLGAGPFGAAVAGAASGEVLARRGERLERVASLAMAPLAAGEPGVLFGAFAPGKAALQDLLSLGVDPAAVPRSPGDLVVAAAAPRGTAPAFGVLHPGGRLELLDARLGPAGEVPGVGAGLALADLDGDGRSELVASLTGAGSPDRIRVIRLDAAPPSPPPPGPGALPAVDATPASSAEYESPPIDGAILAAAAGDLTGDGLDDVVLAAVEPGHGGPGRTTLWLLTLDPREAR